VPPRSSLPLYPFNAGVRAAARAQGGAR